MTATAHAIVGGVIASATVSHPILGITIAALSHPLLDLIPHWDFGWGWRDKTKLKLFIEAAFDVLLGSALAYFLFVASTPLWYLATCVFVSMMWDFAEAPYWFLNWRFPPFSWIYNIQSKMQGKTKTIFGGIMTQIATVGAIYLAIQFF